MMFEPGPDSPSGVVVGEPALHDSLDHLTWRSVSGAGGCVQVAHAGSIYYLRSSDHRRVFCWLREDEWTQFRDGVKRGVFDDV